MGGFFQCRENYNPRGFEGGRSPLSKLSVSLILTFVSPGKYTVGRNYEVLKASGYKGYILEKAPEKVMQFGEGNFLRAFVDDFIDIANEKAGYNGKVVLVQPIAPGLADLINAQEGLYTLYLRGSEKGVKVDDKRVISACSRCLNPYGEWDKVLEFAKSDDLEIIVSNTTEAGIVHDTESAFDQNPPISFPA